MQRTRQEISNAKQMREQQDTPLEKSEGWKKLKKNVKPEKSKKLKKHVDPPSPSPPLPLTASKIN